MIYVTVFGGCLLGMLLTVIAQSEIINQSEKFAAGFNDAFKFYTRKNRGGIYVGIITVIIFMYLIPNLLSSDIKWFENFLENARFWSIGVGVVSQALGFLVVKKSHKKLDDVDKTN